MDPEKVKAARKRAGLTQNQLAESVGVTQPRISAWERGKDPISEKYWDSMADALDVTVDELRADDRPNDNTPTEGRTVRTSADVNRWRDALAEADLDFNVRGILSVLPAFQDKEGDWPLVVVTVDELEEGANIPREILDAHWDEVVESPFVERVKDVEWVLRLVFPED